MEGYKRLIRTNKDLVRKLNSLLNNLIWFLPEKLAGSEIAPEAVSSILGMITTMHEHVIETNPTEVDTRCAESSSVPLSLYLTLLQCLEPTVEVAADLLYGEKNKWNAIAVTEAIKVCIRLAIFRRSEYKMLLQGGVTENAKNDSDSVIPQEGNGHLEKPRENEELGMSKDIHAQDVNLEGRALSALSNFGKDATMQHPQATMEPTSKLVDKTSLSTFLREKGIPGGFFVTGEIMSIIRPLLFVLLMRKYGKKSWLPLCVSLGVDLIGNSILSATMMSQNSKKNQQLHFSKAEKDEVKSRRMLWALYLMRDPFFTKYTRPRLENAQTQLEPVPVVGYVADKVIDIVIGVQTRYTYLSGS